MTRHLAAFGLYLTAALAQSGVQAPRAGCLLGANGSLRPVYGVAGAFLADVPATTGAISAACSDSLALVKTATSLEVRDASLQLLAQWDAPPGAALFALPRTGQTAFAYYPATGELVQVGPQSAPRTVLDSESLGGDALAIASPDALHLIAVVAGTPGPRLARISVADGVVQTQTPLEDVAAPLALLSDGTVVFADGVGLVIRPPGAAVQRLAQPVIHGNVRQEQSSVLAPTVRPVVTEQRMALPAPAAAIDQMGGLWLAVRLADGSAPVALRLADGGEQTCRVPAKETAP